MCCNHYKQLGSDWHNPLWKNYSYRGTSRVCAFQHPGNQHKLMSWDWFPVQENLLPVFLEATSIWFRSLTLFFTTSSNGSFSWLEHVSTLSYLYEIHLKNNMKLRCVFQRYAHNISRKFGISMTKEMRNTGHPLPHLFPSLPSRRAQPTREWRTQLLIYVMFWVSEMLIERRWVLGIVRSRELPWENHYEHTSLFRIGVIWTKGRSGEKLA